MLDVKLLLTKALVRMNNAAGARSLGARASPQSATWKLADLPKQDATESSGKASRAGSRDRLGGFSGGVRSLSSSCPLVL